MERESFILSGEALGALLPLNVCRGFMNLHLHFGSGTEETEIDIAAFDPDWLGHLGCSSAAKQHLPYPHANHRQRSRQQLQRWFWKWQPNEGWTKSVHDKEKLRIPSAKVVIVVRRCFSFSNLKTTVNKT